MAKRDMSRQAITISDKEWSSIQSEATNLADKIEQVPIEPSKAPEPIIGIVVNCKKLNLRTKPTKAAPVIYEIPADSQLIIDLDKSVNGWLRVQTESGTEGFCMKEFVSIN